MPIRRCFVALVALLMLGLHSLIAQVDSATLSGVVNDPSGAIIASATVQATNQDTNFTQSTRTNSVGLYTFPRLSPGTYRISVKNTGFKEHIETDLVLHVGDTVSVNIKMEIGASSESVSVAASSTLVNTE